MRERFDDARASKVVKVIFYTPGAEMSESEEYVQEMSYFHRFGRILGNCLNVMNSRYPSNVLCIDSNGSAFYADRSDDVDIDPESFDLDKLLKRKTLKRSERGVDEYSIDQLWLCECSTVSGKKAKIYKISNDGLVLSWEVDDRSYYRGGFCHVEIVLGGYSYCVRWGSSIKKQLNKKYSNVSMLYEVLDIHVELERYNILLDYCDSCVRNGMGFNYAGLYVNFFLPESLKYYLLSNGVNYQCDNGAFCSEFVANALAHANVFLNRTQQDPLVLVVAEESENERVSFREATCSNSFYEFEEKEKENPSDVQFADSASKIPYASNIIANASMISPNDLYLLLMALPQLTSPFGEPKRSPIMVVCGHL